MTSRAARIGGAVGRRTEWGFRRQDDDRRAALRRAGGRVLECAAYLAEKDRRLIESLYGEGLSSRRVGTILGLSGRAVRWRADRLLRRMRHPLFGFVLRQRDAWPDLRRRIAEGMILRGERRADVARRLDVSDHRIRAELTLIRGMCEALIQN